MQVSRRYSSVTEAGGMGHVRGGSNGVDGHSRTGSVMSTSSYGSQVPFHFVKETGGMGHVRGGSNGMNGHDRAGSNGVNGHSRAGSVVSSSSFGTQAPINYNNQENREVAFIPQAIPPSHTSALPPPARRHTNATPAPPFKPHAPQVSPYQGHHARGSTSTRRYSERSDVSLMTIPSMFSGHGYPQTLQGVPEELTIQEFAFRRGQLDRDMGRTYNDKVPMSPFSRTLALENIWADYYRMGRESRKPSIPMPEHPAPSPSVENYKWTPLINVFTQTPENATGYVDLQYVYSQCKNALDAMESLIKKMMERGKDWDAIVADVPVPCAEALHQFHDLGQRYQCLKEAANVVKDGGQPGGLLTYRH